mmetsp:Transcript_89589/g.252533  ORF Transcript_89589/g.252533 Transcript_89589/m.252533 type:complete len:440 (-) Transcript_89589:154-1473(-)
MAVPLCPAPCLTGGATGAAPPGMAVPGGEQGGAVGSSALPRAPRPVLRWDGRWGYWRDRAVFVLAPCVVDFEVKGAAPPSSTASPTMVALSEVIRDLRDTLIPELLGVGSIASIEPHGTRGLLQCLRATLVCDMQKCQELSSFWQSRSLSNGRVAVTWTQSRDTTAVGHLKRALALWDAQARHNAVSLELPARWALKDFPSGCSARLGLDSHWYQFASIFGEIASAEIAWRGTTAATVSLLVQFAAWESARAMLELLNERYLYNPLLPEMACVHPAICIDGQLEDLRAGALAPAALLSPASALQGAPSSGGFRISRCDAKAHATPAEVWVSPHKPTAVLGREASCDLRVPFSHMSRQHAVLRLEAEADGQWAFGLSIEDLSTNGTWVNGRRMPAGQVLRLADMDKVSFELHGDPNFPVYLVQQCLPEAQLRSGKRPRHD